MPVRRGLDVLALPVLLTVPACAAFIGAVRTHLYGHDIFTFLDGGWRVLNGQRPLLDFSPGVGPLMPLIAAAGLRLSNLSVDGIGYGTALVSLLVVLAAYAVTRSRQPWFPATLLSVLLGVLAAAPFPLGETPSLLTHAMVYNRYGYALLGVVVMESFIFPSSTASWSSSLWGLFTGIITVGLFFLKPSYGLVGGVLVLVSLLLRLSERARSLGVPGGGLAAILAVMIYLRFDFSGVWRAFRAMAAARSASFGFRIIAWAFLKGLSDFLWLLALALLAGWIAYAAGAGARAFVPLLLAALVYGGEALLLATNAQLSGFPLNAVLAILFADQVCAALPRLNDTGPVFLPRLDAIAVVAGMLCFLPVLLPDAAGLAYAAILRVRPQSGREAATLQPTHLAGLMLYDFDKGGDDDRRSNGHTLASYINDGARLLQKFSPPTETVFNLDFTNPFSYVLLRPPPRGGICSLDYGFQFSDRYKPPSEWLFGGADVIMVPKHPTGNVLTREALARLYLPQIQSQDRLCAQSDWWELYKRPSNLTGCPIGR